MSYDWINNSDHFGGEGNCIRRLLHLALRTWVSGPGSLVAGGHGLCGRFRHRTAYRDIVQFCRGTSVCPTAERRVGQNKRTDATSDLIYKTSACPWRSDIIRHLGAYMHALVALELQLQSTDRDDPVFAGPGPIGLKAESCFSESRFF
jgi:hypothetical protein